VVETLESLRKKRIRASEIRSVVRTMKLLSAISLNQYERSVASLDEYAADVELALAAALAQSRRCLGENGSFVEAVFQKTGSLEPERLGDALGVVVFGSDQGLVGRFNADVAATAQNISRDWPFRKRFWAVGTRVAIELQEIGITPEKVFQVPSSGDDIVTLVEDILLLTPALESSPSFHKFSLCHQGFLVGVGVAPAVVDLLPLGREWCARMLDKPWPVRRVPDLIGSAENAVFGLLREFLFVVIYRCCGKSLAAENASRLAVMQRAENNIDELQEQLELSFHQLRQNSIDDELFDVVSGFEALMKTVHG
jgi:F-type H+-transporting ATPase subunit gamma